MNKSELISKIAEDTGLSKVNAAAAVDSFIQGITKSLKKGQADHVRRLRHVQDRAAQGAHRAQPADRRRHQDSEAPRRPLQRRQGAQDGAELGRPAARKGRGRGSPFSIPFAVPSHGLSRPSALSASP